MNKPNMKCRVCGKDYYCCADSKKIGGWKSMACSNICFQEYMKRIEESRKPKGNIAQIEKSTQEQVEEKSVTRKIKSVTKTIHKTEENED